MTDDPLDALGRELRDRVAGEFRRAAEEEEFDARLAAMRARDLGQVAFELMSRGDTVAIAVAGQVLAGIVIHARGDLVTLETKTGDRAHLALDGRFTLRVVERSTSGGKSFDKFGPESFIARLREIELERRTVDIYPTSSSTPLNGVVDVVAKDHVVMLDAGDATTIIPIAEIGLIVERA